MLAVRLLPIRQQDNLSPEHGAKMETTTTNKEAYKGLSVAPASLIRPVHRGLGDVSAFQGSTENREAFTEKPIEHVKAYRLKDNNIMSGSFEGSSGYKENYKDRGVVKTKSFAPSYLYRKPSATFSNETTSKRDFVAYKDVKKLPYSTVNTQDHWHEVQKAGGMQSESESTYKHDFPLSNATCVGEKVSYKPPLSTLRLGKENVELSTNYKDDFAFRGVSKPKSYAPLPTFIKPGVKMHSATEARESFKGEFQLPPKSFRPQYVRDPYQPPMDTCTNYAESFQKFRFVSSMPSEVLPSINVSRQQSSDAAAAAESGTGKQTSPERRQSDAQPQA